MSEKRSFETIAKDVSMAQAGDAGAMERILADVQDMVYYNCLRMLRDEQRAQDAAQEVLIAVYTKLGKLSDPTAYVGWVKRITANLCKNRLSKANREFLLAENEEGEDPFAAFEDTDEQRVPDKALDNDETRRMINDIVDELPDEQRMCVMLYYYDEMKTREIAQALNVSEGTIKSRLNYARKTIRERVKVFEKQGVKLYGLSPIPFLTYFLSEAAAGVSAPLAAGEIAAAATATVSVTAATAATAAAGTVAPTATASAATGLGAFLTTMTGKAVAAAVALALIGGAGAGVVKIIQNNETEETVAVMETHTRAPARRSSAAPTEQATDEPQAAAPDATEDPTPEPTATATPAPTPTATPRPTPTAAPTPTATPAPVWSDWSTEQPPADALEVETKEQWRNKTVQTWEVYRNSDSDARAAVLEEKARLGADYYKITSGPSTWLDSYEHYGSYDERPGIGGTVGTDQLGRYYEYECYYDEETGRWEVYKAIYIWHISAVFYTYIDADWVDSGYRNPDSSLVDTRTLYRYRIQ